MTEQPLDIFINLVESDRQLYEFYQQLQQAEQVQDTLRGQMQNFDLTLAQSKQAIVDAQKTIDSCELELSSISEQERIKKRHLEQISNYKEYQPLAKELAILQETQQEAEEQVLLAWKQFEAAQRHYQQLEKQTNQEKENIENQINQAHQVVSDLRSKIDELESQRSVKELNVPEEWLERYASMRLRVPDPVVQVANNSCGSCFNTLTNQDFVRLRRREIIQCQACYRLLFKRYEQSNHSSGSNTKR